ncbi:MAG: GrlR family regulatory protein [Candidatus Acidiferrales bacterium]
MVEGFWIVQYEGMKGNGGGVAMFIKGQVFGGDTGYTYLGSYQAEGNSVKAYVTVRNFLPDVPSVLGVVGDFDLNIEGTLAGNIVEATGSLPKEQQSVGIALKLTKVADLPA